MIGSDDPFFVLRLIFGLSCLVFGTLKLQNLGIEVAQNLTYDGHGNVGNGRKYIRCAFWVGVELMVQMGENRRLSI